MLWFGKVVKTSSGEMMPRYQPFIYTSDECSFKLPPFTADKGEELTQEKIIKGMKDLGGVIFYEIESINYNGSVDFCLLNLNHIVAIVVKPMENNNE